MSHRNARLTFHGRCTLVERSAAMAARSRMWPRNWGSPAGVGIGGWSASTPRAETVFGTGHHGRVGSPRGHRPRSSSRSLICVVLSGVVRTGWPPTLGCRLAQSAGSYAGIRCRTARMWSVDR